MGLFDLFKGGPKAEKKKPASEKEAAAAKWADRAGDKRAQNYDRQEALAALAEMKTAEAVAALLKRFTFVTDPSITDQEEKEIAFQGILGAGAEAVEPVRAFGAKAESLAWPMKILKELLEDDAYVDELLGFLKEWDTEYAKFIDPKVQLLVALEEHKHPKIREAVQPFLEDVNETARFHAVGATFHQDDASAAPDLAKMFPEEESFRVKNRLAEGLATRGWTIPEELRAAVKSALPNGYYLDGDKIRKR